MAFAEDLTVFFDTDEFAVLATPSGGGAAFAVIFDKEYLAQIGVSTTGPAALARASDVSSLTPRTSTLTIEGTTYTVTDVQPDGTGLALVPLQAA